MHLNTVRMANQKKSYWKLRSCTAWVLLFFVFACKSISPAQAAQSCEQWSGKALSIQGKVEISRAGQAQWDPISNQEIFCPGDRLRVDRRSRAAILLPNQTLLRLAAGSALTFMEADKDERSWLDLLRGMVHFISRTPRSLNIKTPYVNAGVEGTEFALRVEPAQTRIWVFEGQVAASNTKGTLMLASGEAAIAEKGSAPVRKLVVRPRDAVQWALYYPPVIDFREEAYAAGPAAPALREALAQYRKGDLPAAFARLDALPVSSRTAQYYDLRAGLLLSVGLADEARASIDRALDLEPNDGTAHALQSVIAVTQNESEKALALAQKGVELSPRSPVPQIALSYAHQALFDIEKARNSVEQAVNLAPQDALAWARLAELELSLGYLDRAVSAARKAVDHDPNLARTQTVLGFANLTEIEIEEAKAAFENAISYDPADPLPRLGLGLAKIRQGDLDEGTEQIETAAILDPDNSLIRSYLGKAYYEQKREKLASTEFAIAKELDPKDPTPYFYDAILKQTTNRPVEALRELQKAIELNDNRAVYRSGLQLDADLAARSASLGRIYRDLGFEQRALVEGWRSSNTDPTNYSSHRLLADSYSSLSRHEIARVSELLQSQLLQPINITPVQPQLAESDLFMAEVAGPTTASFNEFNPLFVRNRVSLLTAGIAGSNNTFGDDVVVSGVLGKFSFSIGQFHFETDGFRENNDLRYDIHNVFIQGNISPTTNVQAEFRHSSAKQGDRKLNFESNNFSSQLRERRRADFARIGVHQVFSPNSHFLGVLSYRDSLFSSRDKVSISAPPPSIGAPPSPGIIGSSPMIESTMDPPKNLVPFSPASSTRINTMGLASTIDDSSAFDGLVGEERINNRQEGFQLESQHILKSKLLNLVSGIGYFKADDKADTLFNNEPNITRGDIRHLNIHSYVQFKLLPNSIITTGLSGDLFKQERFSLEKNRLNPKFGFLWDATPKTTIRLAAFRVLKRPLVANQTIESTQVAGFNQFFDDPNGTTSWRYGGALDHKVGRSIFAGLEASWRDLEVPAPEDLDTQSAKWNESLYRAYFFWTFKQGFAVSTKYEFETFDRAESPANQFRDLKTHKLPIRISYNHPSGFGLNAAATYFNQRGFFESAGSFMKGSDDATIVDIGLSYRLPNRLGLISIAVHNVFDEEGRIQQDVDPTKPTRPEFEPERQFFIRALFSL